MCERERLYVEGWRVPFDILVISCISKSHSHWPSLELHKLRQLFNQDRQATLIIMRLLILVQVVRDCKESDVSFVGIQQPPPHYPNLHQSPPAAACISVHQISWLITPDTPVENLRLQRKRDRSQSKSQQERNWANWGEWRNLTRFGPQPNAILHLQERADGSTGHKPNFSTLPGAKRTPDCKNEGGFYTATSHECQEKSWWIFKQMYEKKKMITKPNLHGSEWKFTNCGQQLI